MNKDIPKASFVLVVMILWFLSPTFWKMVNSRTYDAAGAVTAFLFLFSIYLATLI